MMLLTAEQYFAQRRKDMDAYVQGEHAWFGCVASTMPNVSAYPDAAPWYANAHLQVHADAPTI
jgi:hypothetical protein